MCDIDKDKINVFVKNYFKSLRIKRFLILTLLCIVSTYLTGGKESIGISMLVVIMVSFIIFFVVPDLLRSERFLIDENGMKNIKISLFETKSSLFNRMFFRELYKSISISYDGKKAILQTSEPEKAIKKISEEIYGG